MRFPLINIATSKLNEGAVLEQNCVCIKTGGSLCIDETILITDIDKSKKKLSVSYHPIRKGEVVHNRTYFTYPKHLKIVMTAKDYLKQALLEHLKKAWKTEEVKTILNDAVVKFYCEDKPNVLMYHKRDSVLNAVGVHVYTLALFKDFVKDGLKWKM